MLFTPKFWSTERKIMSLVFLLTNVIVFYIIFKHVGEAYYQVGMIPELQNVIAWTLGTFGLTWLVGGLASWWTVKHERIEVSDGFLKSTSQMMLQTPVFKAIKLSTVKTIKDREEKTVLPAGRSVMVVIIHHLLFHHENGDKQEISMVGWDKESVKEMLIYVNDQYPEIFIQTYAFREPSEKILKEYLPLVKKYK